jgi:hypothetical protein
MPTPNNSRSKKTVTAAGVAKTPLVKKATPANGLQASHTKTAKAAFKNFSLSKIPAEAETPKNFLPANKDLAEFQKSLMKRNIKTYQDNGPGMTVTVTDPSLFNLNNGKVDLATLLTSVQTQMRGTQFFQSGKSVIDQINAITQANDIMNNIKNPKQNGK